MKVVPELNLNKHPQAITNGSLCDAENIILSKDTAVIQNENIIGESRIDAKLKEFFGDEGYTIRFAIPCNKEIVLFVDDKASTGLLGVFRYNEELDDIEYTECDVEDHGGKFVGTFTYNNGNLIIAFSEFSYDNDIRIPIRTVELGKFKDDSPNADKVKTTDVTLQSLVPKVLIPYVYGEAVAGHNAYKGFYYFFVRFKINDNNYTQWYNTNASFLLDESSENVYFNLKGPVSIPDISEGVDLSIETYASAAKTITSSSEEFCGKSIKINYMYNNNFSTEVITDKLPYYDTLQLGYVVIRKGFSKAYRSADLKFNYGYGYLYDYIINPIHDIEISLDELINTYYNYYNVKTLINHNNKLYIGNYVEDDDRIDIKAEGIEVTATIKQAEPNGEAPGPDPGPDPEDPDDPNREIHHYTFRLQREGPTGTIDVGEVAAYKGKNGCFYYDLRDCFIFKFSDSQNIAYSGWGPNAVKTKNDIFGVVRPIDDTEPKYVIEKRQYRGVDLDKEITVNGVARKITLVNHSAKLFIREGVEGVVTDNIVGTLMYGWNTEDIHIYPTIFTDVKYSRLNYTNSNAGFKPQVIPVSPQATQGRIYKVVNGNELLISSEDAAFFNSHNTPLKGLYDSNNNELYDSSGNTNNRVAYTPCYMEDPIEYTDDNKVYAALLCGEFKGVGDYVNKWSLVAYDKDNREIWAQTNGGGGISNDIDDKYDGWSPTYPKQSIEIGKHCGYDGGTNMPFNAYNFFIHFVDKYGAITKGYNLSEFYVIPPNETEEFYYYINSIGNRIFKIDYDNTIKFKLNKVPEGYIGFFISYERPELENVYMCYYKITCPTNGTTNEIYCYTGELDMFDTIDWGFDQVKFTSIPGFNNDDSQVGKFNILNNSITGTAGTAGSNATARNITSKVLLVADAPDNMSQETAIKITVDGNPFTKSDAGVLYLAKKYTIGDDGEGHYLIDAYNNENKTLIPCSPIQYSRAAVEVNTKTAFKTNAFFIDYKQKIIFNNVLNQFNVEGDTQIIKAPLYHNRWEAYRPNHLDYKNFNNEPEIVIVPIQGLNTTDNSKKSFARSKIVQVPNSTDLFQYRHYTYFDGHPKTLDWENPKLMKITTFAKNIRRSDVIQDESNNNSWRRFPIEQYKMINENKGDIIKLVTAGTKFIVHTEHSMFLFDGSDSIKTTDDSTGNKIQLTPIDIWDINYKEVLTSTLGRGGISKEHHGIIGDFGYIWYDVDAKRIYRYDSNNMEMIDDTIVNYIKYMNFDDVIILDDNERDRLVFQFNKNGNKDMILSYNYVINKFISTHTYGFDQAYNTKNNSYLIIDNPDSGNVIKEYIKGEYNYAYVYVMINTDYDTMKKLEYVQYKVHQVLDANANVTLPVEGIDNYYAGDVIRIFNNLFDTDEIVITMSEDEVLNADFNDNYNKPYWRFGNWHFNYLWNKIKRDDIVVDNSAILGNYFIVELQFNTNHQIELESVDIKFSNGELV